MAFRRDRRVRRLGTDRYAVVLRPEEQALLVDLTGQLRELLGSTTDDPSVQRLFPTAYHDDPDRDLEYQLLTRDELLERRLAALDGTAATVAEQELDAAGLTAWMSSINQLRLVIGTNLDVSEDDGPYDPHAPDATGREIYHYLNGLLDDIVGALSGGLGDDPAEGPGSP